MKFKTEITWTFKKEFKRLNKRYPSLLNNITEFRENLIANPETGIDLGGGFRKIHHFYNCCFCRRDRNQPALYLRQIRTLIYQQE